MPVARRKAIEESTGTAEDVVDATSGAKASNAHATSGATASNAASDVNGGDATGDAEVANVVSGVNPMGAVICADTMIAAGGVDAAAGREADREVAVARRTRAETMMHAALGAAPVATALVQTSLEGVVIGVTTTAEDRQGSTWVLPIPDQSSPNRGTRAAVCVVASAARTCAGETGRR